MLIEKYDCGMHKKQLLSNKFNEITAPHILLSISIVIDKGGGMQEKEVRLSPQSNNKQKNDLCVIKSHS